ncbi:hypothetical protein [Aquimarina sp. AU474]|uniref:hypothetical protein n=1 Tax=Aquimarina sp. AU474 TaxID=2108529 RepID=UPI000D6856AD|nr:hypothetical protein [Aquimarina sp. AU474]
MKNKILIAILAFLTVFIESCSDEIDIRDENQNSQLIIATKIRELSNKHINWNVQIKANDVDWSKVAAADVGAALTAYANDGSFYTVLGEASAASIKKYGELESTSQNNDTGNINNINTNSANDFDKFGYWHYQCIENVIKKPSSYLTNDVLDISKYYITTEGFLLENNVISQNDLEGFSMETAHQKLKYNSELFNKYGLTGGLEYQFKNGQIDELVFEVMKPYFTVMEHLVDVQEFVSYSEEAEKIIANSAIKEEHKGQILSTMATARYGVQYWDHLINQ